MISEKEFSMMVSSTKRPVLGAIRAYLAPDLVSSIDDVVQEVYIRLYKYIKKNGMQAIQSKSINSFTYVIAKNESLRFNKKNNLNHLPLDTEMESVDNTNQDSLEIQSMIATLARELRPVAELILTGYKQREIAKYLQIPLGTVKSRLYRIRQNLKATGAF